MTKGPQDVSAKFRGYGTLLQLYYCINLLVPRFDTIYPVMMTTLLTTPLRTPLTTPLTTPQFPGAQSLYEERIEELVQNFDASFP
jgi:hypothetical protein